MGIEEKRSQSRRSPDGQPSVASLQARRGSMFAMTGAVKAPQLSQVISYRSKAA